MADEGSIAQFQAITGADSQQASMFLEMSGGNLETAMALFFDGGDTGGAMAIDNSAGQQQENFGGPLWYSLIWQNHEPVPAAWLDQELQFEAGTIGLLQTKNGPCGVLAVINAVIIVQLDITNPKTPLGLDALVSTLAAIISQCSTSNECTVVEWAEGSAVGDGGLKVQEKVLLKTQLREHIRANLQKFTDPGGLVLLVYSCVLSRGVDQVRSDIGRDSGEPPLITGPHALCTTELLSLMLRGVASGNVGAYTAIGSPNAWADGGGELTGLVGLLSFSEVESGIPLCDLLKTPAAADGSALKTRVWICHGGDHFTILFAGAAPAASGALELWHWNGLPPGGPRMSCVLVGASADGGAPTEAGRAPVSHQETFYKPTPGEIDEVVQAHPEDKKAMPADNPKAGGWTRWRYEVVLAIDDPDVQGAERPADMAPEPTFDLLSNVYKQQAIDGAVRGESWRCAKCYRGRFQTMCFGMNDATGASDPLAEKCPNCGTARSEAGWSLWFHYDELPPKIQQRVTRRHAPKIVPLLRTKWPGAHISFPGEESASSAPSV